MRDYSKELENRVAFIKNILQNAGLNSIVFGNSGGKDSALVGILCKKACDNVLGVIMPCQSGVNFGSDRDDALALAKAFEIETTEVDLSAVKSALTQAVEKSSKITQQSSVNIAPRLRMTTLYAIAQSRNALVAGTGNKSERFVGYFTKWGDGAFDFNPIADLTVSEIFEFLRFLKAPLSIIEKAPSAGLYEGQTDEKELGVSYKNIDTFIENGTCGDEAADRIISKANRITEHKRQIAPLYEG